MKIAKLTEDETDALAEPASRMLHGRKRLQAAIEKATDPALFAAAGLAIVEARLANKGRLAPEAPAAGAAASVPPQQRPAAPPAGMRPQAPLPQRPAAAPPNGGGAGTRQDVDLDRVQLDPDGVQATLDEMFTDMVARG